MAAAFDRAVQSDFDWATSAAMLFISANAVLDSGKAARIRWLEQGQDFAASRIFPVYMMLSAYSLENLLKGLIVTRNPTALKSKPGVLPGLLKSHDLLHLFKIARITELPDDIADLLRHLVHYAEWAGRYPIPTHAKAYAAASDSRWEWQLGLGHTIELWRPMIDSLYETLHATLMQEMGERLRAKLEDVSPNTQG